MNEIRFMGNVHRVELGADENLVALSVRPAETPMSPLYKSHRSPNRELKALADEAMS
jgi:hypothetical protein